MSEFNTELSEQQLRHILNDHGVDFVMEHVAKYIAANRAKFNLSDQDSVKTKTSYYEAFRKVLKL